MAEIQEGNVVKNTFFMKVAMFDPTNSSSHPLLLSDVLTCLFQKSTATIHCCMCNVFGRYFYFRSTAMSEEGLKE